MGKKSRKENKNKMMILPEFVTRFLQWWEPLTGSKEIESYSLIWANVTPVYKVELEKGYTWPDYTSSRQKLMIVNDRFGDFYGRIVFTDGTIKHKNAYDKNWNSTRGDSKEAE